MYLVRSEKNTWVYDFSVENNYFYTTQFKNFIEFEFPAKAKISILKKPLVILTTSSSSLQASDLFWPDICGDLVKTKQGELQSERIK